MGSLGIPEALIGYYSDTELAPIAGNQDYCGLDYYNINQSYYDSDRGLLYAYNRPDIVDGAQGGECYGFTAGMAIHDLSAGNVSDGIFSNRIVTESCASTYFPQFSIPLIQDPITVVRALEGIDAPGSPRTNPITGQTTRFAFAGDPVEGTGWLDERRDIYQLLSNLKSRYHSLRRW